MGRISLGCVKLLIWLFWLYNFNSFHVGFFQSNIPPKRCQKTVIGSLEESKVWCSPVFFPEQHQGCPSTTSHISKQFLFKAKVAPFCAALNLFLWAKWFISHSHFLGDKSGCVFGKGKIICIWQAGENIQRRMYAFGSRQRNVLVATSVFSHGLQEGILLEE